MTSSLLFCLFVCFFVDSERFVQNLKLLNTLDVHIGCVNTIQWNEDGKTFLLVNWNRNIENTQLRRSFVNFFFDNQSVAVEWHWCSLSRSKHWWNDYNRFKSKWIQKLFCSGSLFILSVVHFLIVFVYNWYVQGKRILEFSRNVQMNQNPKVRSLKKIGWWKIDRWKCK